jgi:hypothetical protein
MPTLPDASNPQGSQCFKEVEVGKFLLRFMAEMPKPEMQGDLLPGIREAMGRS